ncbi:MAG: thioredoxin family protein [Microbacteriaceae bacterium]
MQLVYFSSMFCEPCTQTRFVLDQVQKLVPAAAVVEHDVALSPQLAEAAGVRVTPTVLVRQEDGTEVFRAEGVPSVNQVLVALARTVS